MLKRNVYVGLTTTATTLLLIGFWSCTDVRLAKIADGAFSSSVKPDISVCSYADTRTLADDLRIGFIIDMSGSNIRKTNGIPATDPMGGRLNAVAAFIQAHPNLKYKIIPFSSRALSTAQCNTGFDVSGVAANQLVTLLNIQNTEKASPGMVGAEMKETWYTAALDCAGASLFAEKASVPALDFSRTHYKYFFVTDGQPTDHDRVDQMTGTVFDMKLIAAAAASYQVIPAFYGGLSTATAIDTLKKIGETGNWFNTATPDDPYFPLVVDQVNQLNFDRFLSYTITQQYRILEFNLVNLSIKSNNGRILADSDIDGVPDATDAYPAFRRSGAEGLLDGICEITGGPGACALPDTCSPVKANRFHMSECDAEALALGDSIDQDGDSIPDFIEFLFGLNPLVDDALQDMDNDGLTNLAEIHSGMRPDDPQPLPGAYQTTWRRVLIGENSANCPANQDFWQVQVAQVPTLPTVSHSNPSDSIWEPLNRFPLSHDAGENVIFAYYIQQAVNGPAPKRYLRGKVIRVRHGETQNISISPQEFEDFGEIGVPGEFK